MGILNIDLNIINLDNNFDNVLIPPPPPPIGYYLAL